MGLPLMTLVSTDGKAPIATAAVAPELSVIVPTFNEAENIERLIAAVRTALGDAPFEIIVVDDDSTDGTRARVAAMVAVDPRVRLLHRIGRRGLATAVTEGMLSSVAPFLAVIDADLQHDERLLPVMLDRLRAGDVDLVVGSRYVDGGGIGDWDARRARVSSTATRLARLVTGSDLSDPMSGFFAITRPAFDASVRNLSGQGYKILLDLCASADRPLRIAELPYQFRTRTAGESKLDTLIVWEYLLLVVDKLVGHVVPARFLSFLFIGALGVLVHMAALGVLMAAGHGSFLWDQSWAAGAAMVFNFFVNNLLTYRDRRLRGWWPLARGLVTFMLVCSVGAVANVGVAQFLFASWSYRWWAAGLAGVAVGAVWNYAASATVTWRKR